MSDHKARSDFLFPTTGYVSGAASVLDMGGTLVRFNYSRSAEEADARAMWTDWALVGNDLAAAAQKTVSKRTK